jgi:hypothetical protein
VIEKHSHVPAFDPVHGQNVFVLPDPDALEKTASIIKEAQISDEIASVIETIKPEAGHRYVLVNGIGAGEFWSSNRNGDYFPESGLGKTGEDYGYETFLRGHNFVHHNNKDPKVSVGVVKAAHYNKNMHRCELLLDTDLSKLAKADPALYEKVAHGQPVDVSMGSKCDFDVCSICSKRSATRAEYCGHLKEAMNQILDDGRKVYAYTPHPRFFDISYVTKGADVTAKALHYLDKQAAEGIVAPPEPERACPDPASHEATVEATYEIPSFPGDHRCAALLLEATERVIPGDVLDKMASVGFAETLSTCSHLGVILRPEEYQRIALVAMGQKPLAEKCAAAGVVIDPFSQGSWFDPSIKTVRSQTAPENFDPKIAALVADFVPDRTIFEPYFSKHLEKIAFMPGEMIERSASLKKLTKISGSFMTPSLAAALALGYLIYRKGIPAADIDVLKRSIHDPELAKKVVTVLIPLIAAGSIVDKVMGFEPPTGSEKRAGLGTDVVLPVAGTYLYSAYARRKAERGQPLSGIEHMFMEYPLPLALGGVAGVTALKRRLQRTVKSGAGMMTNVLDGNTEMTKSADMMTDMLLSFGSGVYRPRLSGLAGMLADTAIITGIGAGASKAKELLTKKQDK